MPNQLVTIYYNAPSSGLTYGWSESHIRVGGTDNDAVLPDAVQLANLRTGLMGTNITCAGIRVSDVAVDRDSRIVRPGDPAGGNTLLSSNPNSSWGASDIANSCLLVRFDVGQVRRATLYMTGVPDALITSVPPSPNYAAVPNWSDAYLAWRNYICAGTGGAGIWGVRQRALVSENAAAALRPIRLWKLAQTAPLYVGAVLLTGDDFAAVGDLVQVKKVTSLNNAFRKPNGQWVLDSKVVDATAGTTTYFLRGTDGINLNVIKKPGFVQGVVFQYPTYTKANVIGCRTRKRGVGGLRPRGRSNRRRQLA